VTNTNWKKLILKAITSNIDETKTCYKLDCAPILLGSLWNRVFINLQNNTQGFIKPKSTAQTKIKFSLQKTRTKDH